VTRQLPIILEQAAWFQEQSGLKLAKRWERAVTSALLRIVARPFSGAPCSFSAIELAGVRRMPVTGFPKHLVFYRPSEKEVLILRVVHGVRDLEVLL
jgi:plasmid stabilization system protein ParE